MRLVKLRASNTHLYPGARMTIEQAGGRPRRGDAVLIEFADLGIARGRIGAVDGERMELDLESHRTSRGTTVAAKRWIVDRAVDGDREGTLRVTRRAHP